MDDSKTEEVAPSEVKIVRTRMDKFVRGYQQYSDLIARPSHRRHHRRQRRQEEKTLKSTEVRIIVRNIVKML